MSHSRLFAALSLLALASCMTNHQQGPPPTEATNEWLFIGGTVAVGPHQIPRHDVAILVRDGLVIETGPASELRRRHSRARMIEASNDTILPGLTDAHGHLYGLGLALDTVNLVGSSSYDEVISRVKERAAHATPGEWILGRGWDQNRWPSKQ